MRILILLMFVGFIHVSAKSNAQRITFQGQSVPFVQALDAIRQQGGYEVAAERALILEARTVTVNVRNMSVEEFLAVILRDQPLEAKIEDKTIILSRKPGVNQMPAPKPKAGILVQNPIIIQVLDTVGNPLVGASVINHRAKQSGMTDGKGLFVGYADKGDVLEISFMGFQKKLVTISGTSSTLTVRLKYLSKELDETVIVGYGTTTKRLNTGNVTTIESAEIERQPIMNPLLALQGRVPGLYVQQLSTHSSSPVKVELRGKNSLNPMALTEPLYIIDGIPQTTLTMPGSPQYSHGVSSGVVQAGLSYTGGQSILFNLNSKDIESISVLKDGDATAIYGSRAANGVILITTKRGAPGPTNFNINLEKGLVNVSRFPKMLDLKQYLSMRRESFKNDGIAPTAINAPDLALWDTTRTTDWFRQLAGKGHHTNVMASLSGGDSRTNFRLSGNHTDRVDLYSRSGGNQVSTAALNLRHTGVNQRFEIEATAKYAYTKVDVIADNPNNYMLPPNAPQIFDENGDLNFREWDNGNPDFVFPFEYLLQPNIVKTNSVSGSIVLRYHILKNLTVSTSGHFSSNNNTNDVFHPLISLNPANFPVSIAMFGTTKVNNIAFEPEINYNKNWGKIGLQMLVGGTLQSADTKGSAVTGMGYTHDDLMNNINNAMMKDITEGYSEYEYAALFGRINLNWDSKYVLNINGRSDGSSRFAPGRQFGNFGSVGLAWIASEENWLRSALPNWMSFVKLRGSYAVTGSDAIGDYEYLSRYAVMPQGSYQALDPYNGVQPYVPIIPSNQQYQWESLKTLEGALSMGFYDDRINLELSSYQKRSGDQLTKIPTPIYTGFSGVTANWTATVQNSGLEAALSAQLVKHRDWNWNMMLNLSRNTNKLISYPGIEQSPYATIYKIGNSLSTQYHFKLLGVDPLTGNYVFEDFSGDGILTDNRNVFPGTGNDDRYVAIDMAPQFHGGLATDLNWKNFGLSLSFYFVNQKGNHPSYSLYTGGIKNVLYSESTWNNRWQKPGDEAKYARFSTRPNSSVLAPIDASFIRLNNIALTYDLPEKIARKLRLQNARFSIQSQNVFTISAYEAEPELRGGELMPLPRIMNGVLSLTF